MNINVKTDLWHYLKIAKKPILMYGMGNGADKILAVCQHFGIEVCDFFASDGFVRGHSFHQKTVLSYSAAKEKYGDFIVLLSFASSLEDVIANIKKIAAEQELYAPDVPVFGNTLFDMEFFCRHKKEFELAYSLFEDEESKKVFENIINYKLSGDINYLFLCDSDEAEVTEDLLHPKKIKNYIDLGAYNGDTIRKLMSCAPELENVIALEPDKRNFRKLSDFAGSVACPKITSYCTGAWSKNDTLYFDGSGNRNSNIASSGGKKCVEVQVDAIDSIASDFAPDYIKYDVEGSEYEALLGSKALISEFKPKLLVSLYHRSEDLYKLPLLVKELCPDYSLYLRKLRYIPAWDLNLYAVKKHTKNSD